MILRATENKANRRESYKILFKTIKEGRKEEKKERKIFFKKVVQENKMTVLNLNISTLTWNMLNTLKAGMVRLGTKGKPKAVDIKYRYKYRQF